MSTLRTVDRATAIAHVGVLARALPWMNRFAGATVVVKYGGNAMIDDDLRRSFAEDVVFLRLAGLRPVVVHGGGPQISAMFRRLGLVSEFRGGYRVTSHEAMDVVRMVLTGQVQREIVGLINEHGPHAVGVSGEDAHLFAAARREAEVDGELIDIGFVGDITDVRPDFVLNLLDDNLIPVVSSVGVGSDGEVYNVNADAAAAALAVAIQAEKFVLLTDVEGLYADWGCPHPRSGVGAPPRSGGGEHSSPEVIRTLSLSELNSLLPSLESGMVPKMRACAEAVAGGISRAHVVDGRIPHSLLLEVFTDEGFGTMVLPDGAADE